LWVFQIVFGIYFVLIGVMHFAVPDGLPAPMSWMYDLSDTLHVLSGTAEILGGLGLILPGLTKIQPQLTAWAAFGLVAVMLGAVVYHIGREEYANIGTNLLIAALLFFVGYQRWKVTPLEGRTA
jgi:uncharacterized membrane protein